MKTLAFAGIVIAFAAAGASAQSQMRVTSATHDLIEAVRDRDGAKLNELLQSRPSGLLNGRASDGDTALNITIARSDHEWTAYLLTKGADPDLPGKAGDTPMIVASRVGFDDAVAWLLKAGAPVDQANRAGETPLIVAVQQRHPIIVKRLLAAGANPDKTDNAAGLSARDYARRDTRSRQILQLIEAKKPASQR